MLGPVERGFGARLGTRLKNISLHPRQARSTALFALAAEIPAAILARMLGLHIQVAVQWQRASAGDWMTYAADVSRRPIQPVPGQPGSRSGVRHIDNPGGELWC